MRNILSVLLVSQKTETLVSIYWAILGVLFVAIVTVSIIMLVNGRKKHKQIESLFNDPLKSLKELEKRCDFCGELIDADSTICPKCGAKLKKHQVKGN